MAEVRLSIAGREYIVTCKDGEEQRLQTLGAMVDDVAKQAGGASGGLNESRLLLFSALLLADKLHDAQNGAPGSSGSANTESDKALAQAVETIEKLAERLDEIADRVEQ